MLLVKHGTLSMEHGILYEIIYVALVQPSIFYQRSGLYSVLHQRSGLYSFMARV